MAETDAPPADIEERSEEPSSSVPRRVKVLAAVVLAVMLVLIVYGYTDRPWSGWIGVSDKKFWDYLELLFVPAALALGVYWLNRRQNERDQRAEDAQQERALAVESQRAQDEALQAYLDQMAQLLIEHPLRRASPGDSLSTVARARTLAVLTKVDGVRKPTVLQFLYESGLIYNAPLVLSLNGADLREANLKGTDLSAASLSEVDLFKADLSRANLINADLSRTNLTKANLSRADLIRTDLSGTNLSEADLFRADLSEADLSGARGWTDDQVESLEGATMPNGQKYEDWIKSRDREEDWGNE